MNEQQRKLDDELYGLYDAGYISGVYAAIERVRDLGLMNQQMLDFFMKAMRYGILYTRIDEKQRREKLDEVIKNITNIMGG